MTEVDQFLKGLDNKRVLVIGDVMVDAFDYCYSSKSRPSPEMPGKRVYTASKTKKVLGGAGNVAANLANLGVKTILIGLSGDDAARIDILKISKKLNIKALITKDSSRKTTVKIRTYIDDMYILRKDHESIQKINGDISGEILQNISSVANDVDAVILSDYNKGIFTEKIASFIIDKFNDMKIPVIVDFKPPNYKLFKNATLVAPNLNEAVQLLPKFTVTEAENHIKELYRILDAKNIMVTLGSKGLIIYDGNNSNRINGRNVKAIDPCGCGDTVRACFTIGMISDLSIFQSAEFANFAASLVVEKIGTSTLKRNELKEWNLLNE